MLIKTLTKVVFLGVLVTLMGCKAQAATIPAPESEFAPEPLATGAIVLGHISDDPAQYITRSQPLADYLAVNLSEFDISIGEVKIAPDVETMAEWLTSGKVDLYLDNPSRAMSVAEQSGALLFLHRSEGDDAEDNVVLAADATDSRGFQEISEVTRGQLTNLGETETASQQVIMVRPGVHPQIQTAIKTLLINMDETNEGRAILEQLEMTQFDQL